MNGSEGQSLVEHCRTFLRGLRETVMYVGRRVNVIRHSYERWAAVQLPDSVGSVLFVCKGNICRSPLAEIYFKSLVEKIRPQIVVRSAGLETTPGKPAHVKAKAVASQYRLSLDRHATTQMHKELFDQTDLILVMEIAQKYRIQRLYPGAKGKVVLLGRFDSMGSLEIADPYSGTSEDFQTCFQQVRRCCDVLAGKLGVESSEQTKIHVPPGGQKHA